MTSETRFGVIPLLRKIIKHRVDKDCSLDQWNSKEYHLSVYSYSKCMVLSITHFYVRNFMMTLTEEQ